MDRRPQRNGAPSRREILTYGGGALAAAVLASGARAAPVRTSAHIVIAGGGAAGLAIASRLSRMLEGARITIVEPNKEHRFQPGYTLVYAGVWQPSKVVTRTAAYVPTSVRWLEAEVTEIDPEAKSVKVSTGDSLRYDFLVVATGLRLDYRAIEGMDESLIGREGIGSIFAGPEAAAASSRAFAAYAEKGGVALFGRPATEMKCAGAPLKVTFLADYFLRRQGNRGAARIAYLAHSGVVFAVKPVNERVSAMFAERDIEVRHNQVLRAIDPGKRRATYQTPRELPNTNTTTFTSSRPCMRRMRCETVRCLGRRVRMPPTVGWRWIAVPCAIPAFPRSLRSVTLRACRAASVKWQVPVAAAGIVAAIAGTESSERYNGYTSCPLITGVGSAMLIEFDYDGNLTPSFPFIDPLKEMWISWFIEEQALKPTYYAMLRGYG